MTKNNIRKIIEIAFANMILFIIGISFFAFIVLGLQFVLKLINKFDLYGFPAFLIVLSYFLVLYVILKTWYDYNKGEKIK